MVLEQPETWDRVRGQGSGVSWGWGWVNWASCTPKNFIFAAAAGLRAWFLNCTCRFHLHGNLLSRPWIKQTNNWFKTGSCFSEIKVKIKNSVIFKVCKHEAKRRTPRILLLWEGPVYWPRTLERSVNKVNLSSWGPATSNYLMFKKNWQQKNITRMALSVILIKTANI